MAELLDFTLFADSPLHTTKEKDDFPSWGYDLLLNKTNSKTVDVHGLRSRSRFFKNLYKYIDTALVLRLRRELKNSRNVLAISERVGWDVAAAFSLIRNENKTLFIIFHGQHWWAKRNRILAWVFGRLSWIHFLCLSEALRAIVIKEYGVPSCRVHTTGLGVDADFFSPNVLDEQRYVVSAGMASRDYRTLATACDGLAVDVKIAADTTWFKETLNLDSNDVPANVQMFSACNYDGLRSLYREALFVVVPLVNASYASGYTVISEAMAMGRAVIVTLTDCPSDLIVDGVSGFYVPAGDPVALRKAIQLLLENPTLAAAAGKMGRRQVESSINNHAYAERIHKIMMESVVPLHNKI